jgi:hypothetical protein
MDPHTPPGEEQPNVRPLGWKRPGLRSSTAQRAARAMWEQLGDDRVVRQFIDVSANVSNNRVFRLTLDDNRHMFIKVSNYGSYFLFREDNDRVCRLAEGLQHSSFAKFMATPVAKSGRLCTYYDGEVWAICYHEVEKRYALPRILGNTQIANLGREIAAFHDATVAATRALSIPHTSTSIKSDAVNLLDRISTRGTARSLHLAPQHLDVVRTHTEQFLFALDELGYDDWPKLPVLVDWNSGNFSVSLSDDPSESDFINDQPLTALHVLADDDDRPFTLFSRWDYDWFRTETPMLDFYFLSRVASTTGDRTRFTYGAHTLTEDRFVRFVAAYHQQRPLTERDIRFLPEAYRFFILHYVIGEGDHFFRSDLWHQFQIEAVEHYLPSLANLDLRPLLRLVGA